MNNHEIKINRAIEYCSKVFIKQERLLDLETMWRGYESVFNDKLTETQFKEVYDGIVVWYQLINPIGKE